MMRRYIVERELCFVGKLMERYKFVVATEGNISARLQKNKITITKSGIRKGEIKPIKDFVVLNFDELQKGLEDPSIVKNKKASTEVFTHFAFYKHRDDINYVIHAHPFFTTLATILELDLSKPILPESIMFLNKITISKFASPSTTEGFYAIEEIVKSADIIVLDRHGVIIGDKDSALKAFHKMEILEKYAMTLFFSELKGTYKTLTEEEIRRLRIFY